MIDIAKLYLEYAQDIDAVSRWSSEIYDNNFKEYFEIPHNLYKRLSCKTRPITDEELSQILIDCPLQLFTAAESLSQFKISQQVIKLKISEKRANHIKSSDETTVTKKQESADMAVLEDKLLNTVYSAIIDRVEREISYSRELIMGAKKIWDSRRRTEESNPVDEVSQLPEYDINASRKGKQYIR